MVNMEYYISDAVSHGMFGATVAILDNLKVALRSSKNRLEEKIDVLETIDDVLRANETSLEGDEPRMSTDSMQYANAIGDLKDYFLTEKVFKKEDEGLGSKLKRGFSGLMKKEWINNQPFKTKVYFALSAELLADTGMAISHYTGKAIESGLNDVPYSLGREIADNIYEVPSFLIGMYVGKKTTQAVGYVGSLFNRSLRDERRVKKNIKQFIKKSEIVDIVFNYVPPQQVAEQFDEEQSSSFGQSMNVTKHGKRIFKKIGKSADYIANLSKNREANYKAQKEATSQRFKDLTDNY